MAVSYYIGLISGTSMDSVDTVLCKFVDDSTADSETIELIATHGQPMPKDIKAEVKRLQASKINLFSVGLLDQKFGNLFATAALELLHKQVQD